MKVKICGITRREDAQLACDLGASSLGFVFADSPRRVSASRAAEIGSGLPDHVMRFGVFVNPTLDEIERVVSEARLTAVQLHGQETPDFLRALCSRIPHIFTMKALLPEALGQASRFDCKAILADPPRHARRLIIPEDLRARDHSKPLYLAGGITETNLASLVLTLKPEGVDLSSGVETSPGIKCAEKMRRLFLLAGALT